MTIDEILALQDFKQTVDILTKDTKEGRSREEYISEFKGERSRREGSVDKHENQNR